ncbi:hypothetical protein LJ739_15740 [Aestuariibacter halophilus]|uniref:Uncharacterized protein n=1 Tax=Fluctibacter halophilus TaxID=226011 RepID=A0ABS8GBA1_9ALTE|nr:hypothetical protein [Aestuariibacter halophilus]MCC2617704.1 hypothetical protein [Aestuariibacter halophilus]
MNKLVTGLLITAIPLAWLSGYWIGRADDQARQMMPGEGQTVQIEKEILHAPVSPKVSLTSGNPPVADDSPANVGDDRPQTDEEHQRQRGEALQQTGAALAAPTAPEVEHLAERDQFERGFNEHERDLQAETYFSDFLRLHDDRDAIDLQKIQCNADACQLIGQFDGEHDKWDAVLEQMRAQDWWHYKGTSSTSATRDGVTYFNVFVNKSPGAGDDD